MIAKKIRALLEHAEFIDVATADLSCRPTVAPKFLLKFDNDFVYLVDYVMSRTWENLKTNPLVSLAVMDTETLCGYQLNGLAEIVHPGALYDRLVKELLEKEVILSTERVIKGVSRGKTHESFEAGIPARFALFKVKIEEVLEIGPRGEIKKEDV
ncbi:MAG TPA: pyridoxamine 5'-phosphate oxidase family protein [Patescibacteria group bacterium]|nr:pyridoxamine 5'-phosphate oxidase family protein [Patescibacteria group bacterium]